MRYVISFRGVELVNRRKGATTLYLSLHRLLFETPRAVIENRPMKMLNRCMGFVLTTLLLLCGVELSHAVELEPDSIEEQSLGEVMVTASRYNEVIPSQKLAGKELKALNSFSVADAIRYFSGLQIKDYGGVGGLKTVNIRSMGTNHMGVYYNGIQLGNAQNGQVDLGKFSLENIEEISLYNGQKSEIFQSAREFGSSGSIYLTTRRPRFLEGEKSHLKAGLKVGSFGLLNPSVLFEYKLSETVSLTFNGEWISSNGEYKFRYRRVTPSGEVAYDTTAVRQNGDIDAMRFEGGVQGYLPRGSWKAYLYHYSSERGVPGAIVNNVWRNGERLWDRNSFAQATYQQDITSRYGIKVNAKYAFDYTHYVNNDDKLMRVDNHYKQQEAYLSVANKYIVLRNWDVSVAYDLQWNGLSEYMEASRFTHWVSAATAFSLADCLKLQASVLATVVSESAKGQVKQSNKTKVTPAVFLSYQPLKRHNWVWRAFYKQAYRMPTFNDLYYADAGNAVLKPENATQYNIGTTYSVAPQQGVLSGLHVGVDGYYNLVTDKIIAYPKGQQFRWTMLNLGKVDIRGIDVQATATLRLPYEISLTGKLQYTYQEAIDITSPQDNYYRDQIPYIPWHSGSAIVNVAYKGWALNYCFTYVGERYNQQENIRYNYEQPWYTNDLSLVKAFHVKAVNMKVTAEVNNLLGQDYEVVLNYPMPKRSFRVGITIEL